MSAALAIAFGVPQAWASRMGMNMKMLKPLRYSEFQAAHHTFLIYVAVILVIIYREAFSHSGATW